MSSFLVCANCSEGFPEYNNYEYCEHCTNYFCSIDCALFNSENECGICTKKVANDYILLHALLRHFKLTKEQAFEIWKNEPETQEK